jgi:hypothetical protein
MRMIIDFLSSGFTGSMLGIAGLIYAVYTYRKSKIGKRLTSTRESIEIIDPDNESSEKIEITYEGIKVPRVIKSKIILWNSGNKTIDGNDNVEKDPIRVEFGSEDRIISSSIIKTTNQSNGAELNVKEDKRILFFSFDYLDPKDGVCIEVIHTEKRIRPKVTGKIKGMPDGIKSWSITNKKSKIQKIIFEKINKWVFASLTLLLGIFIFSVGVLSMFNEDVRKGSLILENSASSHYFLIVFGLLYSSIPVRFFWRNRKKHPRSLDSEL